MIARAAALLLLLLSAPGCVTADLWDWAGHDRYRFTWKEQSARSVLESKCPDRPTVPTPFDRLALPHRHLADPKQTTRALDELKPLDDPRDSAWPDIDKADDVIAFQATRRRHEGSRPLPRESGPRVIVLVREAEKWSAWVLPYGGVWTRYDVDEADLDRTSFGRAALATLATPLTIALDFALTPFAFFFGL
jgi:hypothetical protein